MTTQIPPAPPAPETDPVTQTLALIQPWIDYVPKQQRRLGLFIFLAFLLHISMFFFLRIDSTRAESQHQAPRIHVTVENRPTVSAETQPNAGFWDQLSDPRLFILPRQPLTLASTEGHPFDFTPTNTSIGPSDFPAAAPAASYQFIHQVVAPIDERATEALQPWRQPFSYDETPPAIAAKTTWQWGSMLANRQPSGTPELPSPVSDTDLNPTELRVAVNANGTVEHVLLEQTCQKPELDEQAILALHKTRFQPVDQPGLAWGRATVFWHYSPSPHEEIKPTPPTPQ